MDKEQQRPHRNGRPVSRGVLALREYKSQMVVAALAYADAQMEGVEIGDNFHYTHYERERRQHFFHHLMLQTEGNRSAVEFLSGVDRQTIMTALGMGSLEWREKYMS